MNVQYSHNASPFKNRKFPIVIVCDDVRGPANIGALFRLAEAFGIEQIIFCGEGIDLSSPRVKKTARGTVSRVDHNLENNIYTVLQNLDTENYQLVALEISQSSIPLESLNVIGTKIALVIGNERTGISKDILAKVKDTIHIEMYGNNSSLNVVQATGIALHSIINKLK